MTIVIVTPFNSFKKEHHYLVLNIIGNSVLHDRNNH
jgi:hypothetical protein